MPYLRLWRRWERHPPQLRSCYEENPDKCVPSLRYDLAAWLYVKKSVWDVCLVIHKRVWFRVTAPVEHWCIVCVIMCKLNHVIHDTGKVMSIATCKKAKYVMYQVLTIWLLPSLGLTKTDLGLTICWTINPKTILM